MGGCPLTDPHLPTEADQVLTLQQLIRARMEERGWSYGELERRSGHQLTKGRWGQLGTGVRQVGFPEPATLACIAEVLEVDVTTVVLAAAQTVGLNVRRRGPDLAHLLPAGTDQLPVAWRDAILTVIRMAVADGLPRGDADDVHSKVSPAASLEWPKVDAPSRRGKNPATTTETGG